MKFESIERYLIGASGIALGLVFVLLLRGAAFAGAARAESAHAASPGRGAPAQSKIRATATGPLAAKVPREATVQ